MRSIKMTGDQIRRLREKLNASRTEFAARLSVTPYAVGTWEKGERCPGEFTVRKLQILKQQIYKGESV